jgi:outer membrane biogenesis lipoprotein LolB
MSENQKLRTLALSLSVLLLSACSGKAESTAQSTNGEFQVERLFDADGCTVYRFQDAGYFRYFSKCPGAISQTNWKESCGKSCTREEGVSQ